MFKWFIWQKKILILTRVPGSMSMFSSTNPFVSRLQIRSFAQWAAGCQVQFAWFLQTFLWTEHLQSQPSQPWICTLHRKIQGIIKLLEPWSNFQICFTKMIRRICTSRRCVRFSRARFHAQNPTVSAKLPFGFSGFVNFVSAVAYHFCLNLAATFSQPGNGNLTEPCT